MLLVNLFDLYDGLGRRYIRQYVGRLKNINISDSIKLAWLTIFLSWLVDLDFGLTSWLKGLA